MVIFFCEDSNGIFQMLVGDHRNKQELLLQTGTRYFDLINKNRMKIVF
jgi:hypothetical protein